MKVCKWLTVFVMTIFLSACNSGDSQIYSQEDFLKDSQVVCGESMIAYITEDERVYVITSEKQDYIPNVEGAYQIFSLGGGLVVLTKEGELACYARGEGDNWEQVTMDNVYEVNPYMVNACMVQEESQAIKEIAYFSDYLIVWKDENGWQKTGEPEEWTEQADWERAVKVNEVFGLYEDGTIQFWEPLNPYQEKQIKQLSAVTDIANGFSQFVLQKDGTVELIQPYGGVSVSDWENVRQITAVPYITAGVTEEGTVLVESIHNEEVKEAENWDNIQYVYLNEYYLLGIKKDGTLIKTKSGLLELSHNGSYPIPLVSEKMAGGSTQGEVNGLLQFNELVTRMVIENYKDEKLETKDVAIKQIMFESFSESNADEVLVVCKILNRVHAAGTDTTVGIIVNINSLEMTAYREFHADEVTMECFETNDGRMYIMVLKSATYQHLTIQYPELYSVQKGQWEQISLVDLEAFGIFGSEYGQFCHISDECLIISSTPVLEKEEDILAVLVWNPDEKQFILKE